MRTRKFLSAAVVAAMFAVPAVAFAKDVRDPGRLPRPDRDRDQSAPVSAVGTQAAAEAVATEKVDVRDPGHVIVPDKSKDTVRRR